MKISNEMYVTLFSAITKANRILKEAIEKKDYALAYTAYKILSDAQIEAEKIYIDKLEDEDFEKILRVAALASSRIEYYEKQVPEDRPDADEIRKEIHKIARENGVKII